jgi:hypothetical protein
MDEDRIDALYVEAPEGFIAGRDELVRELKASGDREGAERVRKLRRPTVAAWAVNQLARTHPRDLQELLGAGTDLRAAHSRAASGRRAQLQELVVRRRRLIARLVERAGELLEEAGHPGGTRLDAVGDTLLAATVDEDAAAAVREGRLDRELAPPSGFGEATPFAGAVAPEESRREDPAEARRRARAEELARRADEADGEAGRLRTGADGAAEEVEAARKALRAAERAAERAAREADRAEARAAKLRDQADARGDPGGKA